eukprot:gene5936-6623_t
MRMRIKSVRCMLVVLLFVLFAVYFVIDLLFHDPSEGFLGGENTAEWEAKLNEDTKVILMYSTIWNQPQWHDIKGDKLHRYFDDQGCEEKNCLITYNRKRLQRADALVFHAMDIEGHYWNRYRASKLRNLRQHVPRKQQWLFLSHENPLDSVSLYKPYDGLFNRTVTFSRRSDVFFPYSSYKKLPRKVALPSKNYAKEKDGFVVWAVSKCNLMRQDYALELQRHVHLTVYGRCRHFFQHQKQCQHFDKQCMDEISKYKFYLTFENDFCHDYVTEKYWERIMQESVPVVMGTVYDDDDERKLVIPGSFIDASKFSSIKELGDYLNYLNSNDTAYNEYFAWKRIYALDDGSLSMYCEICKAMHSEKFKKESILDISEVYNRRKTCVDPYKDKMNKFKKQIKKSRQENEDFLSYISRMISYAYITPLRYFKIY